MSRFLLDVNTLLALLALLDRQHVFHLARPDMLTRSRVTDLFLLALARHHQAQLATFDRRIPADAIHGGRAALALLDA